MSASPKKGKRRWLVVLLLTGALVGGGYLYRDFLRGTAVGTWLGLENRATPKVVYYCPMHPDYQSPRPGDCPICNMALVKLEPPDQDAAGPATDNARDRGAPAEVYYCPMHPDYQSEKPGTCPICNMDLVKREPREQSAATPADGEPKPAIPPQAIFISPQKQQLIGVKYGTVENIVLAHTLRTVGQVTYDETKIARIQTRIEGWIEKVFADFTGRRVKKNEPLFSIYSPELLSAQRELFIARRARAALAGSALREIALNTRSLYQATRDRLRLWDISEAQIDAIEKHGQPLRALTLHSPIEGVILTRNAYPGQRVTPEMELYTIADLDTVWVLADLYEYEIPMIQESQTATMTLPYFPGEAFQGRVTFVYPQLDNTTRTLKVRLELPNPKHRLKPDMYANVELKVDYGRQLAVPETAVLDSGTEQIVFRALDEGHLEPRKVKLGRRVGEHYIVQDGIREGDRVVISANFLVDSESQLRSALGGMGGPHAGHDSDAGKEKADGTHESPAAPSQSGHQDHPPPAAR